MRPGCTSQRKLPTMPNWGWFIFGVFTALSVIGATVYSFQSVAPLVFSKALHKKGASFLHYFSDFLVREGRKYEQPLESAFAYVAIGANQGASVLLHSSSSPGEISRMNMRGLLILEATYQLSGADCSREQWLKIMTNR